MRAYQIKIDIKTVAGMVDHTNLKAYAVRETFKKLCDEAKEYGFKSVSINTYPVKMCREFLQGSDVLTGAAVGFPLGQMTITSKVAEAEAFISCIVNDTKPKVTGYDEKMALRLVNHALKSYLEKMAVNIEE